LARSPTTGSGAPKFCRRKAGRQNPQLRRGPPFLPRLPLQAETWSKRHGLGHEPGRDSWKRRERFRLARWKRQDDFLRRMIPGTKDPLGGGPAAEGHLAKADEVQSAIFRRMAPSRKLELAVAMNRQARDLMDSGLRQTHPEFTLEQRRSEIARRILHART
jgi:hypothetical protein